LIALLGAAANRIVAHANTDPCSLFRTKDPDQIIIAVRRGHQVLDLLH
jgi:hypothetical protein